MGPLVLQSVLREGYSCTVAGATCHHDVVTMMSVISDVWAGFKEEGRLLSV